MKFQISFDITDLDKAINIAQEIESHFDILEVGALLIYKYGEESVKKFKQNFPQKTILANAKIVDQSKDAVSLFAQAGADWITVMAGAPRNVIHTACLVAHEFGKKIMLDLTDASSVGQSALEAKSLGVDALLFHKPSSEDVQAVFHERWEIVKGNTQLPVFIASNITRENIAEILSIGANGIVISKAITGASNPLEETLYFSGIINNLE
ncbi:orotidine 5'-phosphate decarboxylase / HUMPS family protein [Candidatus Babela massiliensis]|uniref:3-hexulose-6-phosphate synthase related enzyme n=1 Tax=Candidatus Babela massiliensis TaxID=673862 RepID=V6DFT1_9BACT|nr:orotidine 5'-phosphate decarboxylase / HUMPS family protein [Candidatus Babela massiliensis]CDK30399.1 3-hexulose-6-phosphate synthase related enzyme [Candidatus Babela massiliensis]